MNLYPFGKVVCTTFFKIFNRVHIYGAENVPKEGGVLLCSNHSSNLDPPLVGVTSPRELTFMAKAELFKGPFFTALFNSVNAVPIKRGSGDRQAIKTTMKLLNGGRTILIFPEGTRNVTDQLKKGLSGAGFFAAKTNAAVVPCAVIGPYKIFKPISIVYGKPIDLTELKARKAKSSEFTETIMAHIQALINQNK